MKPKPLPNGLSTRANRCLSTSGILAEKEAVLHALRTSALSLFSPGPLRQKDAPGTLSLDGAELDESFVSPTVPEDTMPLAIENGLSFRANRLLLMVGIPADKPVVQQAPQAGALHSGECPVEARMVTRKEERSAVMRFEPDGVRPSGRFGGGQSVMFSKAERQLNSHSLPPQSKWRSRSCSSFFWLSLFGLNTAINTTKTEDG
jgi:hypothetical protein